MSYLQTLRTRIPADSLNQCRAWIKRIRVGSFLSADSRRMLSIFQPAARSILGVRKRCRSASVSTRLCISFRRRIAQAAGSISKGAVKGTQDQLRLQRLDHPPQVQQHSASTRKWRRVPIQQHRMQPYQMNHHKPLPEIPQEITNRRCLLWKKNTMNRKHYSPSKT